MGLLEDLFAEVRGYGEKIEALTAAIEGLREKVAPAREVYTLADLAELPESPSVKTLRNSPARQPNGGIPDGYKGREKAWYRATVETWRRQLSPAPDAPDLRLVREG